VDPILRSSTGYQFADDKMIAAYREKMFPLADVITPNMDEAAVFAEMKVHDVATMKEAAEKLPRLAPERHRNGGHLEARAVDVP
jgi:hydroxymethylpyrimidine/phosphomethylpyrimidine kinase